MEGETKPLPPGPRHSNKPGLSRGEKATIGAAVVVALGGFGVAKGVESSTPTQKPRATPSITEQGTPGRITQQTPTPENSPASATSPTTVTPSEGMRSISVPPQTSQPSQETQKSVNETETIEKEVKPQLDQLLDPQVPYTISGVKTYDENTWAVMKINNPDTGTAMVIVKKGEDGNWTIADGPGTYFEPSRLKKEGAPSDVIDAVNNPESQ